MANSLASSTPIFPQQPNPTMAMNQNGFGGFNPFMMNPLMFNPNKNSNQAANNNIQNNPTQMAFQNAFFERTYASQLKEL
jgi:hypothetical protein